ncbi:MAG TPA: response regulator transcription factor [Methylomirabilota bacterium]|jgi:DNA-binding NarL/FixJ family response regulator|nr:response regulator transcription factor [Methylomirabilota bacterium]
MKKLSASTEKATVKVSVVDDDDGIRASLATLIRRASSLKLLGEYSDAETALREIPARIPDVLLMDINLPGMNGVECVRQLKSALPQVQVLMLTVYEDNESLFDSLKAGASGYLLKRTASARLLEAIHEVNTGGSPMTPQLARRVVQFFNGPPQNGEASSLARLTPGEREFIDLLAKGYAYKEIAEALKISIDTVRSYVRTVYEKLHVHSRTEAVVKYLRG